MTTLYEFTHFLIDIDENVEYRNIILICNVLFLSVVSVFLTTLIVIPLEEIYKFLKEKVDKGTYAFFVFIILTYIISPVIRVKISNPYEFTVNLISNLAFDIFESPLKTIPLFIIFNVIQYLITGLVLKYIHKMDEGLVTYINFLQGVCFIFVYYQKI